MTQVAAGSGVGSTVGSQLFSDDTVRASIDAIVDRAQATNSHITDIRGPVEGATESYEALMQRASAVKGKPLLYPYIGSGAGNGALVELADGSVKWDMITGIGVHFFGHGHPEIMRASLTGAIEASAKHGNLMTNFGAYEFAENLVAQAQKHSNLKHCFVTTSGAMANESALKVCYQKHYPASRVLAFKHCFMGRSVTMAQIGDSHAGREGIPLSTQVDYMPFWNEEAAEKVGGKTAFIDHCLWRFDQFVERYPKMHACFIMELVQGEGGFNVPPRDFIVALMQRCRDHGIAIWDDEIQSFGRTPRMFAYEHYEVGEFVDVFCVGKMTQACATMYTDEYNPKAGLLSGTFTGSSQDFAAGNAILNMLAEGDYYDTKPGAGDGRIARHHAAFRQHMDAMIAKHPAWFPKVPFVPSNADGIGGMMRVTPFGGDKAKIAAAAKACFAEGVILFWCGHGPYHLRMLPPLGVMKLEDWPRVFACIEKGLAKAAS